MSLPGASPSLSGGFLSSRAFLSIPETGTAEDVEIICVHVLAVMIGGVRAKGQIGKRRHDEDYVKRAVGKAVKV